MALLSCQKQEPQGTIIDPDPTPIMATAEALSVESDTRAAVSGTSASGLTALVLSATSASANGTTYAKGLMTFGSTAVGYTTTGFTGTSTLPADKSSIYVCGLMPAAAVTDWTVASTTGTRTFTGTQDLMSAKQVIIKKGGTVVAALAFTHLLTKIDVHIKAADAAAITAWGKIESIEVKSTLGVATFKNSAAVTLSSGAATFSGAATGPWETYTTADGAPAATAPTTTAAFYCTTLIPPFTATGAVTDMTLTVTAKVGSGTAFTTDVPVSLTAGTTAGKSFKITLTLKTTEITSTASITDWVAGTAVNIDVP